MQLHKRDVVEAAAALLDEYGIADLTMRRLARELSVSPGALYWHFALATVVSVLPVLIVFLMSQRFLVAGMTAGACRVPTLTLSASGRRRRPPQVSQGCAA